MSRQKSNFSHNAIVFYLPLQVENNGVFMEQCVLIFSCIGFLMFSCVGILRTISAPFLHRIVLNYEKIHLGQAVKSFGFARIYWLISTYKE